MSGRKRGGSDGRAPGGGGYAKSGKPRPGSGGNRKDRLEGKGPTPPAHMRTGHPAPPPRAGQPVRHVMDGREPAATVRIMKSRTRHHGAAATGRKWSPAGIRS